MSKVLDVEQDIWAPMPPKSEFTINATLVYKPKVRLSIELPYPPSELNPNTRCHWAVKAKSAKQAKTDAFWSTVSALSAAGNFTGLDGVAKVEYQIVARPKRNRRRDDDNLISSCKNFRDGIAEALSVNDTVFRCIGVEWEKPIKGEPGRVLFQILEA